MKKIICLFLTLVMLINTSGKITCAEELDYNELYALGACLMDAESGRVLFEKNGYEIMANASTTKIMTCILALEYGDLSDIVTISKYAASMPDVQLNAKEGDCFYLKDLLYSLMLESHNDSAVAIAEHIAGSVDEFSDMMNRKAKDIGCFDTYFITPNGLDATDEKGDKFHSTTAIELAKIMAYCIKNQDFLEVTRTKNYSFTNVEGSRSYSVNNKNAFLDMMDGVISGKTGFTNDAGYCYVGALERDGRTYTIALLGCGWPYNKNYKWKDSKTLFNYGINNYFAKDVVNEQIELPKILINNGQIISNDGKSKLAMDEKKYIGCYVESDEYQVLMKDNEHIDYELEFKNVMNAPVKKGDIVGKLIYKIDDQVLTAYNLYSDRDVDRLDFKVVVKYVFEQFFLE